MRWQSWEASISFWGRWTADVWTGHFKRNDGDASQLLGKLLFQRAAHHSPIPRGTNSRKRAVPKFPVSGVRQNAEGSEVRLVRHLCQRMSPEVHQDRPGQRFRGATPQTPEIAVPDDRD